MSHVDILVPDFTPKAESFCAISQMLCRLTFYAIPVLAQLTVMK